MIEVLRSSINNGKYHDDADDQLHWQAYITKSAQEIDAYNQNVDSRSRSSNDDSSNSRKDNDNKITMDDNNTDHLHDPYIISIGCNADNGVFKGQFEDLSIVNEISSLPIFYNDFVIYVYQLLKAKTCGAHVVKLYASILNIQDINYMNKIALSLGITCIIVVSSKIQLITVINEVQGLQAISVTSRNMRIWKVMLLK